MEGEVVKFPEVKSEVLSQSDEGGGQTTVVQGTAGLRTQVPGGMATVSCLADSSGLVERDNR